MFVLFTRPVTKAEAEPLFVGCKYCIFFHVLLTTSTHVHKLSEECTRGCCRDGTTGRNLAEVLQRDTEPYRNEVTSPEIHGKWNQSLSLPSQLFSHFSSKNISRIYHGNPDEDNQVLLVKAKPKTTLNLGKTIYKC